MLEILKEVTDWNASFDVPNHTYLLNKNKLIAYAKEGTDEIVVIPSQMQIDRRYRKFVKTEHSGLAKIAKSLPKDKTETQKQEKPEFKKRANVRVFKVETDNKQYAVELYMNGMYSCSCVGFGYRRKCRHIDAVKESLK